MKLLYFSRWLRVYLACACLALAACGARVDLMGAVPEDEANEVLSALLKADIAALTLALTSHDWAGRL